jgi:hypothetical protein
MAAHEPTTSRLITADADQPGTTVSTTRQQYQATIER